MLALVGISVASVIICVIYVNITKNKLNAKEILLTLAGTTVANIVTTVFIPSFEIGTILFNAIVILLLVFVSYRRSKILSLCAVYAIFTVIISLLSANLSGVIITFAYMLTEGSISVGRVGVQNDIVMLLIYLGLTLLISYTISRKYGNYLHDKIRDFDDALKKKLAQYLLYGAIITLTVFFVLIFLRYVVQDEAILTLVYALALAVSFSYLIFATFAFANSTRMEIELRHKEELMHNLQAYTERVDTVTQELRNFKHDNMNMMLGFGKSIDLEDWDGLRRYYKEYMAAFTRSVSVNDAIINKLKKIHIPPLASLLLAKCVQAQQQNTEMWVEVADTITIPDNDFILLDLCRVAGILLDNALEACKDVKDADVRFLAMSGDYGSMFVFENTCHDPPPVNEMFSKGFSTKDTSRGLGLYSAAQILVKNPRVTIETDASNGIFIQKLKVLN